MTTIIAHKDQGFIAVSVLPRRVDGTLVVPDASPLCVIFRMNPETGEMAKDLDMGTLGELTLSLVAGSAFLYSAGLSLAPANFSLYELVVSYSYDGSSGSNSERVTLLISDADTIAYRSQYTTQSGPGTTFKAPTPTL